MFWFSAVKRRDTSIVKFLIKNGADLQAVTKKGWTPLHLAVKSKSMAMIELLCDWSVDFNQKSRSGMTPLHCGKFISF